MMKRWQLNPLVAFCVLTGGHIWSPETTFLFTLHRRSCVLCGRPWSSTARTQRRPSTRLLSPARLFTLAVVVVLILLAIIADAWWVRLIDVAGAALNVWIGIIVWRRQREIQDLRNALWPHREPTDSASPS